MELARNPSDKNITNWIAYNKKKSELNKRLQNRMREYLSKRSKLTPKVSKIIQAKQISAKPLFDPSRFRIRMFFDSKCPHCKKMFETLLKLQQQGIYVEALQTDDASFKKSTFPIPIRKASKAEIKKHKVLAVPFTLIADLKKKVLYPPVRGFQSVQSMTTILKKGEGQ